MAAEHETWLGKLFNRIKPGSSFAAFPWKSWSKVCLILETIKGIGCRINRTRSGQNWSIEMVDEDGFPSNPHAYQVCVRDPDISVEDYEAGDYDDLKVYCYMPDNSFPMCGANGPNPNGLVGDTISSGENYPVDDSGSSGTAFSWGWHLLEEETSQAREFYVVGEVAAEDWEAFTKNGVGPVFENIECMDPDDVTDRLDPDNFDQKRWLVPIAYVNNNRVVQLLCGRPNMWMEVPDADCTPESGSNDPGQSIQRRPSGDGESGGSESGGSGGGTSGMLQLFGFHDPSTMDPEDSWKGTPSGGQAAPGIDDCIDVVVRDKTGDRKKVNYVRPSDLFEGPALDTDETTQSGPPGESIDRATLSGTDYLQLRQFTQPADVESIKAIGESDNRASALNLHILLRKVSQGEGSGQTAVRPKLIYVVAATGPFWTKGGTASQNFAQSIKIGDIATNNFITISAIQ